MGVRQMTTLELLKKLFIDFETSIIFMFGIMVGMFITTIICLIIAGLKTGG